MNRQIRNYIFMFSAILTLAGAALFITDRVYAPYVFAIGAAGIAVCFMTAPYKDIGFRRRRLHRMNVMAGVSMVASSVMMFKERMEWVVFLLISSILILYTSLVSPRKDE